MPLDDVIDELTATLKPVRRRSLLGEVLVLALVVAVELGLWLLSGRARAHIGEIAATMPAFWWKLAGATGLMVVGGATALSSADPMTSPRPGLFALSLVFVLFVASGVWLALPVDIADLARRAQPAVGPVCASYIVRLSLPPLAAFGLLLRRGAPTDPAGASIACGFAAAGCGAFVWIFGCAHDDPAYVLPWYTASVAFTGLLARLILPRLLRW